MKQEFERALNKTVKKERRDAFKGIVKLETKQNTKKFLDENKSKYGGRRS